MAKKAQTKEKDIRKSHPGRSGRPTKYGEPTVLIPVFYCPASKEAELKQILRAKLDEYRATYLDSLKVKCTSCDGDGKLFVSNCCGAEPQGNGDSDTSDIGICPDCGDHCEYGVDCEDCGGSGKV